ncbi:MAG: helix-turn-helix domain-containing protein [Vampirovibrio sp.]|nr:helix-turn-helix domain-containing protein [Vampirovibrio sp.]
MTSPLESPDAQKRPLPTTLARRVRFLREELGITPRKFGELCILPEKAIEDIEAGIETFLAPSIRVRMARILRVKPEVLKEVERRPPLYQPVAGVTADWEASFQKAVLENPDRAYYCPNCGEKLNVRVFDRWTLEGVPVVSLKVRCSGCLFRSNLEKM